MTMRTNAFWFFVAFLVGGAAVWWTKLAVTNAWFAAMVAAGVVFALMIYYLINDEDAPEQEGDNVYYLGLLFTLISLMFALLDLFGSDAIAIPNAEKIRALLENFGIALTSTVVGIAGRVVLHNWQRTGTSGTTEIPEDIVGQLAPPASASSRDLDRFNRHLLGKIARELTQGANALARFHRIVRSHSSESEDYLRTHSETLQREGTEFKETLQRNVDSFTRELKSQAGSTLQAVESSLGTVAQQTETFLERLRSAHDGYLSEIRENTRIFHDEIQSASSSNLDALRRNLDAAAQVTQVLPKRLRSTHDDYLAEIRETTRAFHDNIQSASSQNLDALQQNFDAAAKQSLSLAENLSTVNERIGEASNKLESGLGRASDASAALGNSADQAAKSTAVLEVKVEKLHAALDPLRAITATMAALLDAAGELDARIRAGRDSEQAATAIGQIGDTLRSITDKAATATNHAARAVELIDALTRSIQTTEGETRRAAEALRILATEAETRAESLRQRQGSAFGFWKRGK